jgi:hypothetical protein
MRAHSAPYSGCSTTKRHSRCACIYSIAAHSYASAANFDCAINCDATTADGNARPTAHRHTNPEAKPHCLNVRLSQEQKSRGDRAS